jgi:hypothetical protein
LAETFLYHASLFAGVPDLSISETYVLSQILVCGDITWEEFRSVNQMPVSVQRETIDILEQVGILDETFYEEELIRYTEQ